MNSAATNNRFGRGRSRALLLALLLAFVSTMAVAGGPSPPTFTKAFLPDTIGPGSVSMLVFTIDNSERPPAAMMAFDDELPFGMDLAAPAFVSSTCGGTVTLDEDDADSAFDVRLVDGMVGLNQSCEIVVNVTATTDCGGVFEGSSGIEVECANTSGDLTSSAGNSGPATASLFVDTDLPGFTKSFGDMGLGVPFGGRTTLTFTIDNSASGSDLLTLSFTDTLPAGMVVANPANASTDCGNPPSIPATLVAKPGESVISLQVNGVAGFPALGAEDTCTVTVDVIGGAIGMLGNVTSELLVTIGATQFSSGKAAAVLEVTGVEDLLELRKEFIDDPAAPGGTTTLEFTVTNKSRDEAATGITFDDDLGATLAGLAPAAVPGLPSDPCGAGSSLSFTPGVPPSAVLTLTGGTLAAEASCTFSVVLDVPPGASPGTYPNTAGPVSGDVGGSPETGNTAGDLLFVVAFPQLTKSFTPSTVAAGDSVTLEFTITNPASSAMTGIAFDDELTDNSGTPGGQVGNGFLPFPVSVTIPPGLPCGAGSALALTSPGTDRQALSLTGGSLAAAGMAGDSCTFSVTVDIPIGLGGGIYLNTTEEITATVDAATVTGPPASDTLVVASAPQLTKEFTDDPVLPAGGPVTLEFNLLYDVEEGTPDATAIAFTDDLTAIGFPGLVAATVDSNTCPDATVDITTDPSMIVFTGGTLTPGASCTVVVTLTVPAASPVGSFTNTTSKVTATVDGVAAENLEATDTLLITPLTFTKEFTDDPVIPGQGVTLVFTIENKGTTSPVDDASSIAFTDSLTAIVSGVTNPGAPSTNTCGGTDLGIPTFLAYSGGSLAAGATCTIVYDLLTPAGVADGDYPNVSSVLSATIDGVSVIVPAAVDVLSLDSNLLEITKEFTDDPVLPGGAATLEFTITNLSDESITGIAFDDDLGAALTGLTATSPAITNTCGGMATLPTSMFSYSGGSLDPLASCTITLLLDVPDAPLVDLPPFLNTTSDVIGTVGGLDVFGIGASDELQVQTLVLEKTFSGVPAFPGGTVTLIYTIINLDSLNGVSGLAFSDDLDAVIPGLEAVLPPTFDPACPAGWVAAGTSFLAFTNGSVSSGFSVCEFEVTLNVPDTATAGSFLNTTSELFSAGIPVAAPATAFLDIESPPTFAKEFIPDTIFAGAASTLTFTIDNTASTVNATGLDFTDVLPAPVVIATPSGATTDCTGGTLTAMDGAGTISYTGGTVGAGASCAVLVDVTSDTNGMYVNTSGDLTSSSGNSGPASDALTVEAGDADLELVKTDLYEPVMSGRYQVYQLAVNNLGPGSAEAVVLTDPLPAGTTLVYAEPAALCSEAGGVVTCAIGDLGSGASFTATIVAYVELTEMPAPLDNLATVTSDTTDPDPGNNDVMEMTEVIPQADVAALADVNASGFADVAVPLAGSVGVRVKDTGDLATVWEKEVFPDGWLLAGFEKRPGLGGAKDGVAVMAVEVATGAAEVRVANRAGPLVSTSVLPAGFLPVAMTVIPDDGSPTPRTLIAVAALRVADLRGHVVVFDSADGTMLSIFPLHPLAWPIDLAAVSSFAGDPLVELGVVWVSKVDGAKWIQVKQLSGTHVKTTNLPSALIPAAMVAVPNCCGGSADELAVLGWNQLTDRVRVRTVSADTGLLVSTQLAAVGASPAALAAVPQVGGSSADELAALYRNAPGRAAVRLLDAAGGQLLVKGFGPGGGSVPLGLAVAPNGFDTVADELAVYWLDPATGDLFVTLRDAGSGSVVSVVPIP